MSARITGPAGHVVRHRWFYIALALGGCALGAARIFDPAAMIPVGGDVFYGSYLLFVTTHAIRMTPADLRRRAAADDEGIVFIAAITFVAACFTVFSIFRLLNGSVRADALHLALAIGSAPLAWFVLHANAGFHYAHVYYGDPDGAGVGQQQTGGLRFPGTAEPGPWEFVYYAFVIGMTAQVSDVQVESTPMRKLTIIHGVVSFFFNTVLIAMAVNVVVALFQAH
ncbi:MAG TPA: DUF1345 domain-containing protein [Rhizomicrobium sp.]